MTDIIQNIQLITDRIKRAAVLANRDETSIQLLAVSKTKPADAIRMAYQAGLTHFGENYLQEALQKKLQLTDLPLIWHFIGPIQSKKAKDIAQHFTWVHSVDRLKVAELLNNQRPVHLPPLQVCIQVNISQEDSKSGCSVEEVFILAKAIAQLPNLQLRGLMSIPEPTNDVAHQRATFAKLNALKQQLNHELHLAMDTLSMGMTDDLEAAIAEGATIVRIGTAIFGERSYKN